MFIKAANNVKFSYSITIKCIIKNEESEELRKCVKQHSQYAEKPIFFLLKKICILYMSALYNKLNIETL